MRKVILLVFVALAMFACTKEKDVVTSNSCQIENDLIHYANADENVIDYKTAKYLTYLELEKELLPLRLHWQRCWLSICFMRLQQKTKSYYGVGDMDRC